MKKKLILEKIPEIMDMAMDTVIFVQQDKNVNQNWEQLDIGMHIGFSIQRVVAIFFKNSNMRAFIPHITATTTSEKPVIFYFQL